MLRALSILLFVICAMTAEASAQATGQGRIDAGTIGKVMDDARVQGTWDSRWGPPGPDADGQIFAIATIGTDLYIGGEFKSIGNVQANNIARWDGHAWHALGDGPNNGVTLTVRCLLADGDSLFVGGEFESAGGIAANDLAVWHPARQQWSTLGGGITSDESVVTTMLKHGTDLYVGGSFSATSRSLVNNIARWDGRQWNRLAAGLNGMVAALEISGERLYAGGEFTTAGEVSAHNLACWDIAAARWSDVDGGTDDAVYSLLIHNNDLYVGGSFAHAGTIAAPVLAVWNEAAQSWKRFPVTFQNLPSNTPPARVNALAMNGSDLYIGGFYHMGTLQRYGYDDSVCSIIRWNVDREEWRRLDHSLVEYDTKFPAVMAMRLAGDLLYIGGHFPLANSYEASNICGFRISDSTWLSFGTGVNGTNVQFFYNGATHDREPGGLHTVITENGSLYVGGYFSCAGGQVSRNVARWDGGAWNPLGLGLGALPRNAAEFQYPDHVNALLLRNGELVAGGLFSDAASAYGVARWDGTRWWPMRSPDGNGFDSVAALVVARGDLYAAGRYVIGDSARPRVARWSGTEWVPIGEFDTTICALAADSNALYVGGLFKRSGDLSCNGLARYDLSSHEWSGLNGGVARGGFASIVRTLLVDHGKLYAGGDFDEAGGISAQRVAVWDGHSWSAIGAGLGIGPEISGGSVRAIAIVENDLYIGGDFTPANGFIGSNLMMWDGESWREVDQGLDGRVNALAARGKDLVVCGDFHHAGESYVHYLTVWSKADGTAEVATDEVVTGASAAKVAGVLPNPASDRVTIALDLPRPCSGSLMLYDALGNAVATIARGELGGGHHLIQWNIAELINGNYFLRLVTPDGVSLARLVVAR